jgi:hypothetical protein
MPDTPKAPVGSTCGVKAIKRCINSKSQRKSSGRHGDGRDVIVSPNATKVSRLTWCIGSDVMRALVDSGATGARPCASATHDSRKRQSRNRRLREAAIRDDGIGDEGIRELGAANPSLGNPRHAYRVSANRVGSARTGPMPQGPQICAKSATRPYGDRFARRRWPRLVASTIATGYRPVRHPCTCKTSTCSLSVIKCIQRVIYLNL